jgi:hypothetical protein
LGIDLFKSVLMYFNGTICLIKLLFKMGLFTVYMYIKIALVINFVSKYMHAVVCFSLLFLPS